MAESILTSITMAGGALNIYYDTILLSKTEVGTASYNMPSGWKVCIITSYNYDNISLVFPFAVFNASFTIGRWYCGICMNDSGVFTNHTILIFDNSTKYHFNGDSRTYWSLIFAA